MNPQERSGIERTIVSAALCSAECCRIALEVLPEKPFRSRDADTWNKVFYWTLARLADGRFDPLENPTRLALSMVVSGLYKDWLEVEFEAFTDSLWTPLMYEPDLIRSLCEVVRDENAVQDQAYSHALSLQNNEAVRIALSSLASVPPPTGPNRARKKEAMRGLDI